MSAQKEMYPSKRNRKLQVSRKFISQRAASPERITGPEGIILRMNRSIQSEGAFGVVKQDHGFRRFLLRGSRKVTTEILLIAMAYNVKKLHSKIQQNSTGTQLFKKRFGLVFPKIEFHDPMSRPTDGVLRFSSR